MAGSSEDDVVRRAAERRLQPHDESADLRRAALRQRSMEYLLQRGESDVDTIEAEADSLALAIAWLEDQWGRDRSCPYCAGKSWQVGLPGTLLFKNGLRVFPVMCETCGHTTFVNAEVAGLGPVPDRE